MSQSNIHQYVGFDVSLKETSICVVDENGKIVWRGRTDSTPEAIAGAIKRHARHVVRIGLESGQLSTWLFHGLKERALPVICIDARHAKAALLLKVNKTDANNALGLVQIMRVGWYREVAVKDVDGQALRALLGARAQLVSQITTLKNTVRGILKTFGLVLRTGLRSQFPKQVREAIHDNRVLAPIVEPTFRVLEATRAQLLVYDRAVMQRARNDETARQLMSAPGAGAVVVLACMAGVESPEVPESTSEWTCSRSHMPNSTNHGSGRARRWTSMCWPDRWRRCLILLTLSKPRGMAITTAGSSVW